MPPAPAPLGAAPRAGCRAEQDGKASRTFVRGRGTRRRLDAQDGSDLGGRPRVYPQGSALQFAGELSVAEQPARQAQAPAAQENGPALAPFLAGPGTPLDDLTAHRVPQARSRFWLMRDGGQGRDRTADPGYAYPPLCRMSELDEFVFACVPGFAVDRGNRDDRDWRWRGAGLV